MKRIYLVLAILIIVVGSLTAVNAFALSSSDNNMAQDSQTVPIYDEMMSKVGEITIPDNKIIANNAPLSQTSLEEYLLNYVKNYQSITTYSSYDAFVIDVTGFGLKVEDAYDFCFDFVFSNPGIFYLQSHIGYIAPTGAQNVKTLIFITNMNASEIENAIPLFEEQVSLALGGIKPFMTDYEKALYIHDYICLINTYNFEALSDSSISCRTSYDTLVTRTSVCQGYALAFNYLMECVDVEAKYVYSDNSFIGVQQNHGWSVIKINGAWYYVDVTHDDASYGGEHGEYGIVSHDHFLLSEQAIRKKQIASFDRVFATPDGVVANDINYEDRISSLSGYSSNSALVYFAGNWYFSAMDLTNKKVMVYKTPDPFKKSTVVLDREILFAKSPYYRFSTVFKYGKLLYITTPSEVWAVDFIGNTETGCGYSPFSSTASIMGADVYNNNLRVVGISDSPTAVVYAYETDVISGYAPPVKGDLNDDYTVDVLDAITLKACLAGDGKLYGANVELADFDSSGDEPNTSDLEAMITSLAS